METLDEQINNLVLEEIKWDPKIVSNDIGVSVKDGVVSLSGFASSYWEKEAAEKAVKRIFGVKGVADDIRIKPSTETDPQIARNAVHALKNHPSIPNNKIQVTVRRGWVTLEGNLEWQYEKCLAESAVKNLKGVMGVSNEIKLVSRANPSNVKNDIEKALRRSAEIDARGVVVAVDGSTVKLSGNVRCRLEKNVVEQAAWCAAGVNNVENHIVITHDPVAESRPDVLPERNAGTSAGDPAQVEPCAINNPLSPAK